MTELHFSDFAKRETPTVMETIMKPLSFARRSARWLVAAGVAVASFATPQARAGDRAIVLEEPGTLHPAPESVVPFFEKTGAQRDCDYVTYRLRFGARGDPAKLNSPGFVAELKSIPMSMKDQIPAGLEIVDVQIGGDGTDAGGGAMPAAVVSTTSSTNDTMTISDFRLSGTDLDGSGPISERYIDVRITARIDHAAFPAPAIVANQAFVTINPPGGSSVEVPSRNPAVPDDGDSSTGVPTRITIDVSDCTPPPPPPGGREECFKVDTGTVDCVPGGGAFIYHMPVGAEMAGKWVQVNSTTPGVTVAPSPQLVPAGGGILNWTITGANPGDVVHLVVTGIEPYAGPEEGFGLCCTQTVDIVIPPDLKCPPREKEPDIKVEKRADVTRCEKDGGCDFTITVTNAGDGDYNGPIVLDEVTMPGNATVDSGPNAPWACAPLTSPMKCTHPATTLHPGESVELKLGFKPGPGWDWPGIRNCAAYDYDASGKPHFGDPTNDKACAVIPICVPGRDRDCTPPQEKKADLGIRKSPRSIACTLDGVCYWRIDVYNAGTSVYHGPLSVTDDYPSGAPASSEFNPTPPWTCGSIGGGQFQCDLADISLAPGAFTTLTVKTVLGDGYSGDQVENCATVKQVPDETNLANNKACAKQRVPHRNPGKPALRITKTCDSAVAGAAISCRITVTSLGTAAPSGPVRVNDAATILGGGAPVQIQTVSPDGPEWSCGSVPADTLSCEIPGAVMTPGTSRHFDVTLSVPANQRFENCARGSYGPAPGDDIVYPVGEACAKGGTTIRVEKTGDSQCEPGRPCTFEITIFNDGDTGFSGPVRIGDAMGVEGLGRLEGVEITEISPPFGCSPEPATLPFSCVTNLSLGAGASEVHRVTVVIPDDGRFANANGDLRGRNCVAVVSPDTPVIGGGEAAADKRLTEAGDGKGEAYACHPFTIARPKAQCSEGFVMNDAGRCVCPQGTAFRDGQCTQVGGAVPIPPPRPRPECPKGTTGVYPNCQSIERPQCPKGTTGRYPNCRQVSRPECPEGTTGRYPNCRPIVRHCPQGTTGRYPDCRPIVQKCPKGMTGRYPDCRPIVRRCPQGTTGRYPNCKPIVRECPQGTIGKYPNCRPVVRRCPQGTVGRPPNCRKVREPIPNIVPKVINPDVLRRVLPRREEPRRQDTIKRLQIQ